jgi:large subunit ribosomal protein L30
MTEQKAKQEKEGKKQEKKQAAQDGKLLVVRVRGTVRLLNKIHDTMEMLRLYKKNYCVLLENNPVNRGMIQKAKDFLTWGVADDAVIEELFAKRGHEYTGPLRDSKKKIEYKGRYVEYKGKKYNKFFALNPPRGGFGRKGTKRTFAQGGAIGDRGEKINDFVRRMI